MLKRFSVPGKAGLFVVKKQKGGDDSDQKRTDCKRSSSSRAVDASSIHIVPKNRIIDPASSSSSLHSATSLRSVGARRHTQDSLPQGLPFEQTFRLQVNLPKNQIAVIRVGPRTVLGEVRVRVCQDRDLDPAKYELRHAVNLDEKLNENRAVTDYRLSEVALVPVNRASSVVVSRSDIYEASSHAAAMMMLGDAASKTGTMSTYKSKSSMGESSASSDSLDDLSTARSLSPPFSIPEANPAADVQNDGLRPRVPPRARKRPAPAPPAPVQAERGEQHVKRDGVKLSHASSAASSVGKGLLAAQKAKTSTPKRDEDDADGGKPFDQSGLTNLTSIPSTSMISVASSVALGQPGGVPAPVMPPGVRKRKGKAPPPPPVSNVTPTPPSEIVASTNAAPEPNVVASVPFVADNRVSVQVHPNGQAEEGVKESPTVEKVVDAPEAIDASSEQTDEPTASHHMQVKKRVYKTSQSASSEYFDAETGLTPDPVVQVGVDPSPVIRPPSVVSVTSSTSSSFSSEFAISLQRAEKEKKRLKKKKKTQQQLERAAAGQATPIDSDEDDDEVLREDDCLAEAEGCDLPTMERVGEDEETTVLDVPSILPDPPTPFKDPSQRHEVDSAIQMDDLDSSSSEEHAPVEVESTEAKPEPEERHQSSPEPPAIAEEVLTITVPIVEKEFQVEEEEKPEETLEVGDNILSTGRVSACRTDSTSSNSTVASLPTAAVLRERASSAAESMASGRSTVSTPPPLPKTPVPTGDDVSEFVDLHEGGAESSGSSRASWDSNCEGEAKDVQVKKENVAKQDIAIQTAPSDLIGFTIASYGHPVTVAGVDTSGRSGSWDKDEGSRWHPQTVNAVVRRRDSSLSSSSASSVGRTEAKQLRDDRVKSMIDFGPLQVAGNVPAQRSPTASEEDDDRGWESRPMKSLTSITTERSSAVWGVESDSSRVPESVESESVASSQNSDIVETKKPVRPRSTFEASRALWGLEERGKDRSSSSASASSSSSVQRTSSDAEFFEGDRQQPSGPASITPVSLSQMRAQEHIPVKVEMKFSQKRSSSVMDLATPAASLQSVQVVRDLLPQISQSTIRLQDVGKEKPEAKAPEQQEPDDTGAKARQRVSSESDELEEEVRRYKYRGPPKITLASWQERRPQGAFAPRLRTEDLGGATSQRVPRVETVVTKGVKPAAVKAQEAPDEERQRAASVASSSSDEAQSLPTSVDPSSAAAGKEPSKTKLLRDTIVAQASKPSCDSSLGFNEETGLKTVLKPRPASENSGKPFQDGSQQPVWLKKANSIASNYAKAANAAPPAPVIQNQSSHPSISAPIVPATKPTSPEVPVTGAAAKPAVLPASTPLPKVSKVRNIQATDTPRLSDQIIKEFKAKSSEMRQRNGWELTEVSGGQQPPKVVGVHEKADAFQAGPPPPPPPPPAPGMQIFANGATGDSSRTRTGKRIVSSKSAVQVADPREDLLSAIRNHAGRAALRKASSSPWMKP